MTVSDDAGVWPKQVTALFRRHNLLSQIFVAHGVTVKLLSCDQTLEARIFHLTAWTTSRFTSLIGKSC